MTTYNRRWLLPGLYVHCWPEIWFSRAIYGDRKHRSHPMHGGLGYWNQPRMTHQFRSRNDMSPRYVYVVYVYRSMYTSPSAASYLIFWEMVVIVYRGALCMWFEWFDLWYCINFISKKIRGRPCLWATIVDSHQPPLEAIDQLSQEGTWGHGFVAFALEVWNL